MRKRIAGLPDGTYHYEDYLETFPGGEFEPLLLPLALTIAGDRMTADFTGAGAPGAGARQLDAGGVGGLASSSR